MKTILKERKGSFKDIYDSALITAGKTSLKEPTESFVKRIILSEHSPIRRVSYNWIWEDLPYWVSNHFVRHWLGIEHFVKSQRSDRTGLKRDNLPQGEPITHEAEANIQALINISRKRLCINASNETRTAWIAVVNKIVEHDNELHDVFVPDCIYRGYCYEMKTCGYCNTPEYKKNLEIYRRPVREYRDGEM